MSAVQDLLTQAQAAAATEAAALADAQAQVADLTKRLAALTKPTTLLGAWVDKVTGETTYAQALARYETAVNATVKVSRCYDFGNWTAGLQSSMLQSRVGHQALVASFETNASHSLADIANGVYDSDITGLLAWISANRNGYPVWLASHHEFDAKVSKGTYTFAQVAPAMLHVDSLIRAHDDSGIISTNIMTGFQHSTRMGSYWPTLSAGHFGARGVDPYQGMTGGDGKGVDTETVADLIGPMYTVHQAVGDGAQFLVCELGNGLASKSIPDTPAQVAAFINSIPWLYGKAAVVCWFNKGLNDITGVPEAAAAMGALLKANV